MTTVTWKADGLWIISGLVQEQSMCSDHSHCTHVVPCMNYLSSHPASLSLPFLLQQLPIAFLSCFHYPPLPFLSLFLSSLFSPLLPSFHSSFFPFLPSLLPFPRPFFPPLCPLLFLLPPGEGFPSSFPSSFFLALCFSPIPPPPPFTSFFSPPSPSLFLLVQQGKEGLLFFSPSPLGPFFQAAGVRARRASFPIPAYPPAHTGYYRSRLRAYSGFHGKVIHPVWDFGQMGLQWSKKIFENVKKSRKVDLVGVTKLSGAMEHI